MKKMLLAAVVLAFVFPGTVNAQLGRLRGEAKKAIKEAIKDDKDDKAAKKEAGKSGEGRPKARKDAERKYPPGVSYSSLLNGVAVLAKNGQFRLNHVQGTFIPEGCEGGFVVLRTADGKELFQIDWKPDRLEKPYTLLSVVKQTDLRSGETIPGGMDLATPGDYVLDFYLPDEHFYTYPFSVARIGGDDPFGEGKCYVLEGDWRDWGYLYYREAKPDQSLQWKVWLRNNACDEKDIKIRVEIKNDGNGELVCTSRELTTHSVQPQWIRLELDMVFPEGKEVPHGTYFKAMDLLKTDGAYTLTMQIDGEPYGTWKFTVEDGKFNYTGRTLRDKADSLTFIEGGRDAWWYAKEK
ncbi:MAG: hypothetical protein ABIG44_07315 [Planctomycetota bacterium]